MMGNVRSLAGEARTCPHCKGTILKSSASCPLCHHVLKFTPGGATPGLHQTRCPLRVEGTVSHGGKGQALEYSIFMEVHDAAGKLVSRQVVGVGAVPPAEKRIFSFRVELTAAEAVP